MMVDARKAYDFVNSHAPINAQIFYDNGVARKFFILSEEVDRDGNVRKTTDVIPCVNGRVDLEKVREVLGY